MTDQERLKEIDENKMININGFSDEIISIELDNKSYAFLLSLAEKCIEVDYLLEEHVELERKQARKIDELEKHIEMYKKNEDYLLVRLKRSEGE